jgi:type IV secretory pathway TraG/TraD family ATPase VirD4
MSLDSLTESRKFGGCALLALQSPAQLEMIYGRELTSIIIGNCGTRIAFSEQDPEIARRISKTFGESESKEYQESISYGAHEMRDGVNLSYQSKVSNVVSPTRIQSLATHEAFVKLPGNLPITKIRLKYMDTPRIQAPYLKKEKSTV